MAGLERIIQKIAENGDETCRRIREQAEETCRRIVDDAAAEADAVSRGIADETEKQVQKIASIGESGAALNYNRRILEQKGALIAAMIQKAKAHVATLDDAAYFDRVEALIRRYAEPGDAQLVLTDRDLARMPQDFLARVNAKLTACKLIGAVGGLKDSSGGVMLNYEQTVQNCTIDALIEEHADDIRDTLGRLLFA